MENELLNVMNKNTLKKLVNIPLSKIKPNRLNDFDDTDEEVDNFAQSVYEAGGIKSPIHVYEHQGYYMLLGGEKRYRASLLNIDKYDDAPLTIPAIVEEKPEDTLSEELLIEELNENRKLSEKQLINKTGKFLRLWDELDAQGKKPTGTKRKWFAKKLSVGEKKAELLMKVFLGEATSTNTTKQVDTDPYIADLESSVCRVLGTKVKFKPKSFTVKFESDEDLNRILDILGLIDKIND